MEFEFDATRPRLVAGNHGLRAVGIGKSFNKRRVVVMYQSACSVVKQSVFLGQTVPVKPRHFTCLPVFCRLTKAKSLLMGKTLPYAYFSTGASRHGVFAPNQYFRGLTVEQNIRAVLETLDGDDDHDAALDDLMAEFGITHLRNTPSVSLSGGERRRLEIARALAARPTFLLLDEPLAGIDPIALGEIRDLIAHLKTHGIGVLITDHNVRETLDIVDRAYIIHDGTMLMEGPPDAVVRHSGVRAVYLGDGSL